MEEQNPIFVHGAVTLRGAGANNLRISRLSVPLGRLVVVSGVSGSGKSSLALATLHAEGMRRYVSSLSAYARQFLRLPAHTAATPSSANPAIAGAAEGIPATEAFVPNSRPIVGGMPPSVALGQQSGSGGGRSTVGTVTEIYDYLRLLYARAGHVYSPVSGMEVLQWSPSAVAEHLLSITSGHEEMRLGVLAPIRGDKSAPAPDALCAVLPALLRRGFSRLDVGGKAVRIEDAMEGKARWKEGEEIFLLVDRLSLGAPVSEDTRSRLYSSVETAFEEGDGTCAVRVFPEGRLLSFSSRLEADGMVFSEPEEGMFSFSSPLGACEECGGFGKVIGIDEKLVVPDTSLSVYDGAVACWRGEKMGLWRKEFIRRAAASGFPIFKPYYELTQAEKDVLWHGSVSECLLPEEEQVTIDAFFRMLERGQYKIQYRVMLARYRGKTVCPRCHGSRLRPEAEYVKVGGRGISELVRMPVKELLPFFEKLKFEGNDEKVARRLLEEIRTRLSFLCDVGLGYLTLDRSSNTLSGGESQRISLATRLGSALVGTLYVLDEPSIGLHPRDTDRLIAVLKALRDQGNTVVVVEHDEDIIRAADWLIDIGPEAGNNGGRVVYEGKPVSKMPENMKLENGKSISHTLNYLCHLEKIKLPSSRRSWNKCITIKGARANNLKGIDVQFPLNCMVVVTGVSGSGKSTLVSQTLYPALKRMLDEPAGLPGEFVALEGDTDAIERVEYVNQKPIGTSTRSNPATYLKAFEEIRKIFAETPQAKYAGMTASYFSFNSEGGRCPVCKGEGVVKVEMQFMGDLELPCEECGGKRFKEEVLEVKFEGKNIYDILEMTVDEAVKFFTPYHKDELLRRLRPLQQVGLGYLKLGQSSSTLSGGENQRVKLAYFLSQETPQPTLFIFDEPTTGLHFHDINCLLSVMNALIERGHSLLIVEHNMEMIKSADHIIDLGPEGGMEGGYVVAAGTPEEIIRQGKGYTAKYLKKALGDSL